MEIMNRSTTVETFDGKTIERTKARRIKGQYYEIGVSCFRIADSDGTEKWHRKNNGKIAKNNETGKYEKIESLHNKNLVRAICDESQEIVFIKPDKYNNVFLKESLGDSHITAVRCKNSAVAEKIGYSENFSDGFFYNTKNLSAPALKDLKTKRTVKYETTLNHNANEKNTLFRDTIDGYSEYKPFIEVDGMADELSKLIGNFSFGMEFETSKGYIPKAMLGKLGLVPLRDGSITGHEYTTIPLEGPAGIQTIKHICDTLTQRCEVNHQCSFHIHLGGFNRTYVNLLALYETCRVIQGDIFDLVSPYKKDPVNRAGLEKDYCRKLPDLGIKLTNVLTESGRTSETKAQIEFDKVFFHLSGDQTHITTKWNIDTGFHPSDTNGTAKWNIHQRYMLFNFISLIFTKAKTFESRIHHGTTNFTKVINWLLINTAILNFVEKNAENIILGKLKPTLKTIILGYGCNFEYFQDKKMVFGEKVADYLCEYVKSRSKEMTAYEKAGEWIPKEEYKKDGEYKFEHGGFTTAF